MRNTNLIPKFILSLILLLVLVQIGCKKSSPLNLQGELNFNLNDALQSSVIQEKKLLIYFTSYGCAGCLKMEDYIFNDEVIKKLLIDNYNFKVLFTDDRTEIQNANAFLDQNGELIKYNGNLNSYYQQKLTRTGSQPVFAIVENDSFTDNTHSYTLDKIAFRNFLKKE